MGPAIYYFGNFYTVALSLLLSPLMLRLFGAEAFGLIAFSNVAYVWFQVLDLGISATLGREIAIRRMEAAHREALSSIVRSLMLAVIVLGLLGGALLYVGAEWFASAWLRASTLTVEEVTDGLRILAAVLFVRFLGGVPRAVLYGHEQMGLLGSAIAVFSTLRYLVLLPLVLFQHLSIIPFFLLQLVVSAFETAVLLFLASRAIPNVLQRRARPSLKAIRPLLPAAMAIAATSLLWLLASQVDRLVLSATLSLSDYALYSLAVAAAGGVTVAINPLIAALLPGYCRQYASSTREEREASYRRVVEIIAGVTALVAAIIGGLSYDVLLLWTRDAHVASFGEPIVLAYALGNFAQTVAGLPYFLQFAAGRLKMHVIGSVLFVAVYVPGTLLMALKYGAVGVGLLWLLVNVVYAAAWVPVVHRRFLPGLRNPVFFLRVLKYPLLCFGTTYLVATLWPPPEGLWLGSARILGATVLTGLVVLLFSIPLRDELKGVFTRWRRVEIEV